MSSNKNYSWESIDDDFFIWLFSNDRDVNRANDEDSIRSHFIAKLPVDLDLRKGVWEMGVDKIILNNEQSNGLDYNFKDEDDKVIKSGSLLEKRYFTTFEVIEDVYEKGKEMEYDKTVVNKTLSTVLTSADLKDEEIGIYGYDEDRNFFRFTLSGPVKWSEIESETSHSYNLTSWDSLWGKIYRYMEKWVATLVKISTPDFSTGGSINWTTNYFKQFLFDATITGYVILDNRFYLSQQSNGIQNYRMFEGLSRDLQLKYKQMAIVFAVTEKIGESLRLRYKK